LLSYYGFIAAFPLLTVLATVLEIVLRNDPELQQRVLDSALTEFPVIGDQLRSNIDTVQGSGLTLAIGLVIARRFS